MAVDKEGRFGCREVSKVGACQQNKCGKYQV